MPRLKSRIIVAAVLALVTGTAAASDWQVIGTSMQGHVRSIDLASLTRHGNIVRVWSRTVYAVTQEGSAGKYLSEHTRWYFDCAEYRAAARQVVLFADKEFDEVVYDGPSADEALLNWQYVPLDSAAEAILEFACAKAPK